jgi:hypothetical protein
LPDELEGFREALKGIPYWDLVALGKRGVQFLRQGDYPPLRGTWVKFAEDNFLLYTQGYVPYLRTYPSIRVPQPLEILERHGTAPPDKILQEALALTKMNWNSADFSCREPITLEFAQRVGDILGELPAHISPREESKFYMLTIVCVRGSERLQYCVLQSVATVPARVPRGAVCSSSRYR